MSAREDLDALAARHAELEAVAAARRAELAKANALLAEAERSHPLLDNMRIAAPCSVPWESMQGGDRVRHCGQCDKDVFDLSALTRDEAEALLRDRAGNLCVSYFQRADGTVLTADCSVGIAKRRRRRVMAAGLAALLASAGGLALFIHRQAAESDPAANPNAYCPTAADDSARLGGAAPLAPVSTPSVDPVRIKGGPQPPQPRLGGVPPLPAERMTGK
jgi:hypothetical protein